MSLEASALCGAPPGGGWLETPRKRTGTVLVLLSDFCKKTLNDTFRGCIKLWERTNYLVLSLKHFGLPLCQEHH